ncbi:helix-turn-helix transcriptional regulator [Pacificimonas sp. ICDLI1SI03]
MDGGYRTIEEVASANLRIERLIQDGSGPFERVHSIHHPSLVYIRTGPEGPALGCLGEPRSYDAFAPFGTAVLVPAHVPLHVRSPGFPAREMILLRFDDAQFERLTGLSTLTEAELRACVDLRARDVVPLVDRLVRELTRNGPGSDAIIAGLSLTILGELAHHFASLRERDGQHSGVLAAWQISRIEKRLEQESRGFPDIEELAKLCGIGRRHLMRAYKATTGATVMERVERSMFERATHMLEEGDVSIKELAALLGFARQGSFSTAFRRRFGMTPSEWRAWRRGDRMLH